jgi:hypothetical protein
MSRDTFDGLLTVIGSLLLEDHILSKSMYEAQKLLRALKLTYEQPKTGLYNTGLELFLTISLVFLQSASHGGQPCSIFSAYAIAHKGKATSDVTYNPDDGPEAYSNPTVYSRLHEYTAMAHDVHGLGYDPRTEDIDGDVLMRVGGGKRHVCYCITDGAIDSSSTPTLFQVRARRTSSSPAIRPRQDISHHQKQQLQVSASVTCHSSSFIHSL